MVKNKTKIKITFARHYSSSFAEKCHNGKWGKMKIYVNSYDLRCYILNAKYDVRDAIKLTRRLKSSILLRKRGLQQRNVDLISDKDKLGQKISNKSIT